MQNPSAGVQPPLDKHLHLISGHHFPLVGQLNLQQAFEYLVQAPSVVKQVAPVSWTYVQPPQDGTIWLEWMAPGQNGGRFPSDGYVWADPEQPYRQNINGYTIELMVHQAGFRPGFDHMTSHARTRYHLIDKQGNINAPPPDPSLWIVHYHQAPQQRLLPTSQVPIDAYTRRIMQDRGWLEQQGRIERRDFMLHDREHWPHITVPGSRPQQMPGQPGMFPPNAMPGPGMVPPSNYTQTPFPQQQQGPPSAKRQRVQGPGPAAPAQEVSSHDLIIDEEEFSALGDYFDHLTPREISLTRYQQHHRWMEEVFSSPYASNRIVPVDLGLGLMGELKGLTEGILQPPAIDDYLERNTATDSKDQGKEASFTKLPQEQVEEFNARVQKHIDDGKADIERMKAEHAAKMREWRKAHKLTQAERQLRGATWTGHERAIFKVTTDSSEQSADGQAAVVEDVVDTVEKLTGRKIRAHEDAFMLEKGGLEHSARPPPSAAQHQQQSNTSSNAASEAVSFQQSANNERLATDGQTYPLAASGEPTSLDPTGAQATEQAPHEQADLDMLNDSMDIDGTDLNFDLGDTPAESTGLDNGVTKDQHAGITASAGNVNAADSSAQQGDEMFNESNFDFANDIDGAGEDVDDGLIDFGDDGLGDDSAFGDALHGMDS